MMKVMAKAVDDIKDHGGYLLRSALDRAANTNSRLAVTAQLKT